MSKTIIDLENNIVEFEHREARIHAFLLLSYIHHMEQFKNENPLEFLQNWATSYEEFLKKENPAKRFKAKFKEIRAKNKKMDETIEESIERRLAKYRAIQEIEQSLKKDIS